MKYPFYLGLSLILSFFGASSSYADSRQHTQGKNMIKLVFSLKVTDSDTYAEYRSMIKPLMDSMGITVLKEYKVIQSIHSNDPKQDVNLLAVFGFPSETVKNNFFTSEVYQQAKPLFLRSTTNFENLME